MYRISSIMVSTVESEVTVPTVHSDWLRYICYILIILIQRLLRTCGKPVCFGVHAALNYDIKQQIDFPYCPFKSCIRAKSDITMKAVKVVQQGDLL